MSNKQELLNELASLKNKKSETNDFMIQMELADAIHQIEMKLNNTKPNTSSHFECEGCGS